MPALWVAGMPSNNSDGRKSDRLHRGRSSHSSKEQEKPISISTSLDDSFNVVVPSRGAALLCSGSLSATMASRLFAAAVQYGSGS
jgi:hypothetical protein